MSEQSGPEVGRDVEADFDVFMRRARLDVPKDRRGGVIAVYSDLMRATALLHSRRASTQWTAQVFRVETILSAASEK